MEAIVQGCIVKVLKSNMVPGILYNMGKIKASDAINGQVYQLSKKASRPYGYPDAVCNGWNSSHAGVLFLVFDNYGKRKMLLISPDEEIEKA